MTSSEDFQQALKEGKLNEALAIAISKVPELKITTSITSSSPNSGEKNNSGENPPPVKRLHTKINLVEGEIHNEISEDLMGNAVYQEVQQFHFEQVARGHQTIQKNLESLQNMFRLINIVQKQQLEGNYRDIKYLEAETAPLLSEQKSAEQDSETTNSMAQPNLLGTTDNIDSPSTPAIEDEDNQHNSDLVASTPESTEGELKDEDWGEWLEEGEEQDIDVDLLDLSSLDLDESEEWQDWEGEETQLFAGKSATSSEENKDR